MLFQFWAYDVMCAREEALCRAGVRHQECQEAYRTPPPPDTHQLDSQGTESNV